MSAKVRLKTPEFPPNVLAQTVKVAGATTGKGRIVMMTEATPGAQVPVRSFVVKVRVTRPAALSAVLGVYVVVRAVRLLKLPVPELVQVPPDAAPDNVAVTTAFSYGQISLSRAVTVTLGHLGN